MDRCLLVLLVGLCWPTATFGHGLSAGVAEVQLRGDTAFVVIAPRAERFLDLLDADRDGRISGDEVQVHRALLQAQFERSFQVRDASGSAPEVTFFDVGVPTDPLPGAPAYVRFTAQLRWPEIPGELVICTEWGTLQLEVVRVQASVPGEWLALAPAEAVTIPGDSTPTPPLVRMAVSPARRSWSLPLAVVLAAAVLVVSIRRRPAVALEGSR